MRLASMIALTTALSIAGTAGICAQEAKPATPAASLTPPAVETATPRAAARAAPAIAAASTLEAAPGGDGAPDPLTPTQVDKPAPLAPGAQAPKVEPAAVAADIPVDAVVAEVRARLAVNQAIPSSHRDDRAGIAAFYADARPVSIFATKDGLTARARLAIEEIRRADDWGLKAAAFDLPVAAEGALTPAVAADAEIRIGLAVLKYARHARGGRADPPSISRLLDQKPRIYEPKSMLEAIASIETTDAYLRALHPRHAQFEQLRQAMLAARGNQDQGRTDRDLVQRLTVNMEKWRWMPDDLGAFYVWDAVPEQYTRVFKDGRQVLEEKIVVGKPSNATPVFSADMQFVIFHPEWGVPSGIKAQELGPQLRRASGNTGWFFSSGETPSDVLRAHGLRASYNGSSINPDSVNWAATDIQRYSFTQPAGPKNVLGNVKFRFPNRHDVYMHDTPERHLFNGASRSFSHGCMRVQNPLHLAEVLLAHDKGWSADHVQAISAGRAGPSDITLSTPIPVHVTYFTARVDDAGQLHQYGDLYALDQRIATAIEGRAVALASARSITTGSVRASAVAATAAAAPADVVVPQSALTDPQSPRPARAVRAKPRTKRQQAVAAAPKGPTLTQQLWGR